VERVEAVSEILRCPILLNPAEGLFLCEFQFFVLVWVWGLGFGGLGFGVWGLGFGVWGLGFGALRLGFGVGDLGCGVGGLGSGVWGWRLRVWGSEIKDYCLGFKVEG
jgi:hypothetical protein